MFHCVQSGLNASEAGPHVMHISPRDESKGTYELRHVMSRTGRCSVAVTLDGVQIFNSPVTFHVLPSQPGGLKSRLNRPKTTATLTDAKERSGSPGKSRAGRPLPAAPANNVVLEPLVGQPYQLEIRSRDAFGNAVDRGGGQVDVHVQEPPVEPGSDADHMLAAKMECAVEDKGNGLYCIVLIAVQPGEHMLTVRLNSVEVIGSPVTLVARRPRMLASTKAAGKSRGETLYAVASAIANAGINWAFKNWADWAYGRQDAWSVLRRAARQLLSASSKMCFNAWVDNAAERRQVRAMMDRCIRTVLSLMLRKGYNAWIAYSQSYGRVSSLLKLSIAGLSHGRVRSAFNTWFDSIDIWKDPKELFAIAAARVPEDLPREASQYEHSSSFLKRRNRCPMVDLNDNAAWSQQSYGRESHSTESQ